MFTVVLGNCPEGTCKFAELFVHLYDFVALKTASAASDSYGGYKLSIGFASAQSALVAAINSAQMKQRTFLMCIIVFLLLVVFNAGILFLSTLCCSFFF